MKSHDKGKTFEIIYNTLTDALGYKVYHKIIDAWVVIRHIDPNFSVIS